MTHPLLELAKIQSIWYDNIERRLLKNGELKQLIADGISGVTSNPSIFEKAILSSADYDADIARLAKSGKSPDDIYNELTVSDIAEAADMLKPVFEQSNHRDGFVSIEVSPEYAHDKAKTIESAKYLFQRLSRPNIMIKIPATVECIPAIRELIADGVNINITLIFSLDHYRVVAEAYIAGLEDRLKRKLPLNNVHSVASVFISRIDTRLDAICPEPELKGKPAVANTKVIYQDYRKTFWSDRFDKLAKAGANRQRILWGSTSTKNPAYPDIKYVQEIIAPDSINTVPPATIKAFKDHGRPEITIDKDIDGARKVLESLKQHRIDIVKECQAIQDEGVKSFADAYKKTIDAIKSKTSQLKGK
ncbi:MAG: transaldolase [Candidatus Brocadiia bacterium]